MPVEDKLQGWRGSPNSNPETSTQPTKPGRRYDNYLTGARRNLDVRFEEEVVIDRRPFEPENEGRLELVGNPYNRRVRREHERHYGVEWPRDPVTGRNYDVAHKKALADGGTNTLDNIRPMHPDAHRKEHMDNGDFRRWAERAARARAFGGRVGSVLGPFGIFSDVTGILSGRIRTDSFDNFSNDMMGLPSREDRLRDLERQQKRINPDWKLGDPVITSA